MSDDILVQLVGIIAGDDFPLPADVEKAKQCVAIIEAPLRAENEKLRAALKPFADRSRNYLEGTEWWEVVFTVEECRAAAEALKGNNES